MIGETVLVIPPEPASGLALDSDRDVWQRQDDGWWPAIDQAWIERLGSGREVRRFDRPWTWLELWAYSGHMTPLEMPTEPIPAYTGELPAQDPEPARDR